LLFGLAAEGGKAQKHYLLENMRLFGLGTPGLQKTGAAILSTTWQSLYE
jgi:hypothetical protein